MLWWVTGRVLAVGVLGMAVLGAEALAADGYRRWAAALLPAVTEAASASAPIE